MNKDLTPEDFKKLTIEEKFEAIKNDIEDYNKLSYCEPWIMPKLKSRLLKYKDKHPRFDVFRFMSEVQGWNNKRQKWAPYIKDNDIKKVNKRRAKHRSIQSLAENDNW